MTSYGAIEEQQHDQNNQDDDFPIARSVDHLLVSTQQRRTPSFLLPDQPRRRPYVFDRHASQVSLHSSNQDSASIADFHRDHNMAIRYRLFNRLDPGGTTLMMPDHVIPPMLFSILPFDDFKDQEGKQGSIVTIFSIWNTMMGTSLLAMPWALYQAGLGLGILLMLLMALVAFYTAYRVVESPQGLTLDVNAATADFSDVCRYFWGKPGEYIAIFFSVIVLIGGVIVYWVLMSNFLFYTGNIVYESLQPNSTTLPIMANKTFTCDVYCPTALESQQYGYLDGQWHDEVLFLLQDKLDEKNSSWFSYENLWKLRGTVPVYLAILTFPLMNFKSPTFFTKFNVLGTVSVMYLLIFTFSKALECGFNLNFSDIHSPNYAALYNFKFPALTGTLALSYFIHNAILTILRNQKHPENNTRDLSIGYILSAVCYIFIGFMFYAAFPTYRSCIADNFLNNFGSGDVMSAAARVFLLFQMITVLPLLMYLIRAQLSCLFTGDVYPGLGWVCLLNFGIVSIAVFFAIIYPYVGSILRYVGSLSGLIYIFSLPCIVHLRRLQIQGRLTKVQIALHGAIILLGFLNLISQFIV
jgi:sodium-coupled neutral amino acid transporter 9